MINLDLKQNDDGSDAGTRLQIEGEMTLEHAAEIKQALLDLLAVSGALSVDCAKVDRVDLAGLQLLCSLVRSAVDQKRQLVVDVSSVPVIQQALADAGFPAGWCEILNVEQNKEAT